MMTAIKSTVVWAGSACVVVVLTVAGRTLGGESAAVTPYLRPECDRSHPYVQRVTVNGTAVDAVMTEMNVGYTHFSISGEAVVELTLSEPITNYDVSPHRTGVRTSVDGNVMTLQLSEPRKLHVQINELPRFFVFADAPEAGAPRLGNANVLDLRDFDVHSNLEKTQTAGIQHAIDYVAARRGTLIVPRGVFRCGELKLRSGLTLYLAPGAVLRGTGAAADFPVNYLGTQFLLIEDCENVAIKGRGVIDGNGRALRLATENRGRLKLVRTFASSNVAIEGVVLRDSGTWAVHLAQSEHVHVDNVKLISNSSDDDAAFPWEPNTDGFDPDNSSHVLIENSFVSCHDDAIAVKLTTGKLRDMHDVRFDRNVVWTAKSALKIGTEVGPHPLTGVAFTNNDVIHADRGITLYCYRGGTVEGPRWENNYFEFIGGNNRQRNVDVCIQDEGGRGEVIGAVIKDNVFERFSPERSRLEGLDEEHAVREMRIVNLQIGGERRGSLEGAQIRQNEFVRGTTIK